MTGSFLKSFFIILFLSLIFFQARADVLISVNQDSDNMKEGIEITVVEETISRRCDNSPSETEIDTPEEFEDSGESYSYVFDNYEINYVVTSYKEDRPTKFAMPVLFRLAMGEDWEFRISSDFLEYSNPYVGINDFTAGVKWNFLRFRRVSMAVTASLEFPTGSSHFSDDAFLPSLSLSLDYKLSDKFDLSMRLGWSSKVTSNNSSYKDEKSAIKLGYKINGENYLYAEWGTELPDQSDREFNLLTFALGYNREISEDRSILIKITRGLSDTDKDWVISIGFSQDL